MSFRGNYYQKWRKDAASEERIDGERVWGTMYMYSKPTASNAVAAAGKQQTQREHIASYGTKVPTRSSLGETQAIASNQQTSGESLQVWLKLYGCVCIRRVSV